MNPERIILHKDRLKVSIVPPGQGNIGSRFDWTGWVEKVELDGVHHFGSRELSEPSLTHGFGLCNEFGIDAPIGYEDCPVGGQFPKLGIGLLTRPDGEAYDFFRLYPVEPFPLEIEQGNAFVRFTQSPLPCRGYEAKLTKTVAVEGSRLRIDYELTNTGSIPLVTNEYNHNFTAVDGRCIGPGYRLSLPFASTQLESWPAGMRAVEKGVEWTEAAEKEFYAVLDAPQGTLPGGHPVPIAGDGATWRLEDETAGAGMQETLLHAPLHRFALWGRLHVASPEMFVHISLKPGETKRWAREYTFFGS